MNNTELKNEGMKVLSNQLGLVNAERFIALIIIREPFNYTEWQRNLFGVFQKWAFIVDSVYPIWLQVSVDRHEIFAIP